jgi:hypothetical protein
VGCVVVAEYDDGKVICTDQELVIRDYYFPAGSKRLPYSAIREVRRIRLSFFGQWRIYGSSDFIHWSNFDIRRPRKNSGLVIYASAQIRPLITPDDTDRVAAVLAGHGVTVTSTPEPGLY